MRSILEKAIVHLLNEKHEEAEALFHRFVVGRARQIHESLRQGDDALEETWNDEMTEEYFKEEDLDGLDAEAGDDVEGDIEHADSDLEDATADVTAADDLEHMDDVDGDVDDVEGDLDGDVDPATLDDIRDQLDALTAQFAEYMDNEDETVDASELPGEDDDVVDGDVIDEPVVDEVPAEDDGVEGDVDADADQSNDNPWGIHEEDEFADIAESITSELAKVTIDMGTGTKEVGAGKTIEGNKKSGLTMKKAEATDAKPVATKAPAHVGFEREVAPASRMIKKQRNTLANADQGRSTVDKSGDKGALLNKDFAGK